VNVPAEPTKLLRILTVPTREAVVVCPFAEPLTGIPMLGIHVAWRSDDVGPLEWIAEYDHSLRLRLPVERTELGYHFGGQMPMEDASRLQLSLLRGDERIAIADDPIVRPESAQQHAGQVAVRKHPRWLSPWVTLGTSLVSGDCFQHKWWTARVDRYQAIRRRLFVKLRDKLSERRRRADPQVDPQTSAGDLSAWRTQAQQWRRKPVFSILCPVYNVAPIYLNQLVESVRDQVYPHWQLCLADDASTDSATIRALEALPKDDRIRLVRRPANGHIVAAMNTGAELATGDYVVFVDNDDALPPQALFRFAELLQTRPELDLIYSDEAKITPAGRVFDVQHKPGWSPDLLLSYNYLNHLVCLRRTLFESVGRLRPDTDGAQDFDLMLRATARTDRIAHIPEVLYHWRALPSSSAAEAGVKPYIHTSARKALEDDFVRRGLPIAVIQPDFAQQLNLPAYALELKPEAAKPTIAAIVYGPSHPATIQALKATSSGWNVNIYLVLDLEPTAESLNRTAAGRTEDYLLFLQAGVVPKDERVWSRLCASLALPNVGTAGGWVHDEAGRSLSAGTIVTDQPRDAFAGMMPNPVSYYFLAEANRTVTAPAAGCLLTPRSLFERLGGFDSSRFGRTLFDVEYCLRAAGQGFRSVHVGGAVFVRSRGNPFRSDPPTERRALFKAYGNEIELFHNPNFEPTNPFRKAPAIIRPSIARSLSEPPKVLFVTHNLSGFEGAPKVLFQIAVGLADRGAIVGELFSPFDGIAAERYRTCGIAVHTGGVTNAQRLLDGQWSAKEYEQTQRELVELLKRLQPKLLVVNTIGMFPFVDAAAKLGIPAQWILHESYSESVFIKAFSHNAQVCCARAFATADRVIGVSRSCVDLYVRFRVRDNTMVIHNALEAKPFDDLQRDLTRDDAIRQLDGGDPTKVRFVSVGTVCERKAQHVFVEAAAILAKTHADFTCLIVGAREGSSYLSYVRNLVQERGLAGIVTLIPEGPDVPRWLRSADAFVCTSYVEAYSLSVLEAMAFGLPIVSTPCGGLDEQVVWGHNALQFPFGDAAKLAEQLGFLLVHPNERMRMSRESRAGLDLHDTPAIMLDRYRTEVLRAAASGS